MHSCSVPNSPPMSQGDYHRRLRTFKIQIANSIPSNCCLLAFGSSSARRKFDTRTHGERWTSQSAQCSHASPSPKAGPMLGHTHVHTSPTVCQADRHGTNINAGLPGAAGVETGAVKKKKSKIVLRTRFEYIIRRALPLARKKQADVRLCICMEGKLVASVCRGTHNHSATTGQIQQRRLFPPIYLKSRILKIE